MNPGFHPVYSLPCLQRLPILEVAWMAPPALCSYLLLLSMFGRGVLHTIRAHSDCPIISGSIRHVQDWELRLVDTVIGLS